MNVRLLPAAQVELDEAIDWYAKQAPGLGESFLVEFLRTIQLIERHPQGWLRFQTTPAAAACADFHTA